MTQIPWFDKLWHKTPIIARWKRQSGSPILKVVADRTNERRQKIEYEKTSADKSEQINDRDFLSRFLEIQSTNESVPPWYESLRPTIRVIVVLLLLVLPSVAEHTLTINLGR